MRKYILSGLAIFLADQTIKAIVISKIPAEGIFAVSSEVFKLKLELVYNTNIAFGVALPAAMEYLLPMILIGFLIYVVLKKLFAGNAANLAIAAIVGAAASNLADRFLRDGVVDFISASFYTFTWPSFNFADIIITCGAIYLIYKLIFKYEKTV
jgi:signal peptidase II